MTRDDIIRIAREAWGDKSDKPWSQSAVLHLERFAELLESKVRADCAKVIEYECHDDMTRAEEAAAILARGEK